jgi:hypothetical protein
MKRLLILACSLMALGAAQCTSGQTLHPLYMVKGEEVFEPALLGLWVSCAGSAFVVCVGVQFEKSNDMGYRVTSREREAPNVDLVYAFHLVRLGHALFGDLKLTSIVVAGENLNHDLGVQCHTIFRVSFKGNRLITSGVDFGLKETQKALAENKISLNLEAMDDRSVLALDSTVNLQNFARQMADNKRVFSDDSEWERPEKDRK